MPLLPFFLAAAAFVVPPPWSATMPLAVGILVVAGCLLALAPLMLASYHLIEAPGIALGRWVNDRLGRSLRKEQLSSATSRPRELARRSPRAITPPPAHRAP